ncbi:hypothetical protein AB0C65_36490 [Nocardia sp. NPDC048505]|uniref:hypothetical protein n=1 Tax=Nocardia sp. NPDC048505 TaxID=3155756 RepID=UPI00340D737C
MSRNESDLRWLIEKPSQPPTILSHWDGFPNIMLFKISSGALLWWMFEDNDNEELGVFVHLTYEEAQAVFHGPIYEGLLEPIRSSMRDRNAVVWNRRKTGVVKAGRFEIPRGGTEPELANLMWEAAEAIYAQSGTSEFMQSAGRKAHDLVQLAGT